ncbi:MAG: GNAT family N-acetyltransferase [Pseudomonadota bacterium]
MTSPSSDPNAAYSLRAFTESDAPALAGLTLAAIRSVGAKAYSPEQVNAWAMRHSGPERFVQRAADGAMITVACDTEGAPVAYALLEPDGHLDMLYCHPDHTRRSLADRLLQGCEDIARVRNLDRLFTESSELARPAFERAGYKVQHRRDFQIEGVAIYNYAMEKTIA